MDMFGMMGEMMENMVSSVNYLRMNIKITAPPCHVNMCTVCSVLLGKDVWFTKLSDVLLFNSDLLLIHRLRGS